MGEGVSRLQAQALEGLSAGSGAEEILRDLCQSCQEMLPGSRVGVTILDRTSQIFESGIFPSLSPDYAERLKGIRVVDKPGSCALAVFSGATVAAPDVASDERFSEAWKALSAAHGLDALVSIPAVTADGVVLGTLVVAHPPSEPLTDAQLRLAEKAATVCAQVLAYRRREMGQDLLVGELQHRVRNLFGAIGAVVYATLRAYPDPGQFQRMFDARLAALARAHSLALDATEGELRQLLLDTLAPYALDHAIEIEGPSLILSHEATVAFGLAAHELATNAAKYGSLSAIGGKLRISYGFSEDREGKPFFLDWIEQGGPVVQAPTRQGFGHQTITRSLGSAFDARVAIDYPSDGLTCRITAPQSPRLGARAN